MKLALSHAVVAAALPSATAARLKPKVRGAVDLTDVQIEASSPTGGRLLSKARRVDSGRRLDGNDEYTWIAGYSLRFNACTTSDDYYGGQFEEQQNNANYAQYYNNGQYNYNGNGQQQGNYYNGDYYGNQQRADYAGMYQNRLVHFSLCPSDSACWRCKNGADYVVTLNDFVDAALEAKMTAMEYNCERVRENCYCGNAQNEDTCLYNCYKNAKFEECAQNMYDNEFDLQEAVECTQLEVEDEDAVKNYIYANTDKSFWNDVYWAQQGGGGGDGQEMGEIQGDLYVGPYCSKNGKKIHLGVFMEESCSYPAPKGIYEAIHYGESLPYSKQSIVDNNCISCIEPREVDYENYWDQQDADNVAEVCSNLYEMSGKCEEKLDGYYPNRDVTGCNFIKTLKSNHGIGGTNVPAKVFAGIFAATTVVLAAASITLFRRDRRRNVSLAGEPVLS